MGYADRGADRYKDGSLETNSAEAIVEAYYASTGEPLVRYGFQGVPTDKAIALSWPPEIRHTPDYVYRHRFIEVKSCWDTHVKIKMEDLAALEWWNAKMPVWFVVYVAHQQRLVTCDFPSIKWAAAQPATEVITLDAGTRAEKQAYNIPLSVLVNEQRVANALDASKVHPIETGYVGF